MGGQRGGPSVGLSSMYEEEGKLPAERSLSPRPSPGYESPTELAFT